MTYTRRENGVQREQTVYRGHKGGILSSLFDLWMTFYEP